MMKAFIWNIRSVKSQKAFQRVQMLNKYHKFSFIALLEPFQHTRHINRYRSRLQMPLMFHNCNGKIWLFVNHGFIATLISDTEQQLSLNFCSQTLGISFLVTIVYAKCDKNLMMDLWDDILSLSNGISRPWILEGDFNVVSNGAENLGGIPVVAADVEDFNNCVEACDALQIQYKGIIIPPPSPLLSYENRNSRLQRPFKFLKFWIEYEDFKEVVRRGWDSSFTNNPFLDYKRKIKQVKKALTIWSR
ncbi:hypothetical protein H5410_056130 [Solanum commersonii]|uniref:Endonuclease/exonuclease/phosphatase domain-containing protein n=1 Tax=Solanum commersonii TaxID=4109 RepID=A0A9J5WLD5_SOLCO|nr:hypothetical protein H5410_056130 [Solanum commersonii]